TLKISKAQDASIRLFVGRGAGSFSANPYDTMGSQLHIVVIRPNQVSAEAIEQGVRLMTSKIPVKDNFMAQVKSCNYLPNVLMKKEAVDQGVDFTIGKDANGYLTEGSTENLIILNKEGQLCKPMAQAILSGTTMNRTFELAESLVKSGLISEVC